MTRTCENPLLQCWFFRARTRLLLQVVLTSVMSTAFDSSSRVCSHWRVTSCPLFVGSSLRRSLSAWAVTCVLRCIMCLVVKPCRLSFEERWQFGFIRTVVSWLRGICRLWTPAGTEAKPEDPAPMSFCPTAAREPPLPPPPLGDGHETHQRHAAPPRFLTLKAHPSRRHLPGHLRLPSRMVRLSQKRP